MKTLFASLATALLLCTVILVRNGFAQSNYVCSGPFTGCSLETCIMSAGNCPAGGMNAGAQYSYCDFTPVSVHTCVPPGNGCNQHAVNKAYCSVICWQSRSMDLTCMDSLCDFSETVDQCQ
jgi:hypothetical protein